MLEATSIPNSVASDAAVSDESEPKKSRILLFGELACVCAAGETPIRILPRTRRARLLLAFLLLHRERTYSREQVGVLLWPDVGEDSMLASLRTDLRNVKNALKTAGLPDNILRVDGQVLSANGDQVTTDVAAFCAHLASAEAAVNPLAKIAALERALALCRGPLLVGLNDVEGAEEWLLPLRRHYLECEEETISRLIPLYAEAGDLVMALNWAQKLALRNPADDSRQETVTHLKTMLRPANPKASTALPKATHLPDSPDNSADRVPAALQSQDSTTFAAQRTKWKRTSLAGGGFVALAGAACAVFFTYRWTSSGSAAPSADSRSDVSGMLGVDLLAPNAFESPVARAMKEYDYEAAYGHYLIELQRLDCSTQRTVEIAMQLYALGRSAHMQGRLHSEIAIAALSKSIELQVEQRATSPSLAEAYLLRAQAHQLRGQYNLAVKDALDGQRLVCLTPFPQNYGLVMHAVEVLLDLGEYPKALQAVESARTQFRAADSKRFDPHLDRFRGIIASDMGDYARARRFLSLSIERFSAIPQERQTRAAVLGNMGDTFVREGKLEQAAPYYNEGLSVWEEAKQPFWIGQFKVRLARVAYYQRKNNDAARLADESLRLFADSNSSVVQAGALWVKGKVAIRRRDSAAITFLQEAVRLRRQQGNPRLIAECLEALAEACARFGHFDTTHPHLAEANRLRNQCRTPVPPVEKNVVANLALLIKLNVGSRYSVVAEGERK